ncbi:MAG: TlpA family protein disulfide reductase [Actinomycetota bacterium]|nr:TlpA family protein disulfide reductase [Actinomycetota bacterium]
MVFAGCASVPDGGTGAEQPEPEQTAIQVQGVASCDTLPQGASSDETTSDRLPPLQLPCLTPGPTIDLAALSGRPVLVNLWASWCGPCRDEMPLLQAAHERYGDEVQFLGVDSKDTAEAGAAFLGDIGVTYPQVVDEDGELLNHLGVPGLPVTVLLDGEGRVAATHVGQLDSQLIEELLADVLS